MYMTVKNFAPEIVATKWKFIINVNILLVSVFSISGGTCVAATSSSDVTKRDRNIFSLERTITFKDKLKSDNEHLLKPRSVKN